MADHPIIPSNFKKFIGTPLQKDILPIIPVSAELSLESNISAEMLGKIPGRYNPGTNKWAGWNWQSNRATDTQLERWHEWQNVVGPIALAVILGEIIVVDADSDNLKYVLLVRRLSEKHLGLTPVIRCRDGSVRIQLFYKLKPHTAPITKQRCFYKDANDVKYLTEVLGRGQQTVGEGPHAKGAMHYWEGEGAGIDLITGYEFMPEVTIDQVDAFLSELAKESEKLGLERVRLSLPTASDLASAVSIDDLTSPHIAKDLDLLARAIEAIDINSPLLADYDRWLSLLRAMWAGCGGNRQFYVDYILPWLMGNPNNKEEDMEAKLISFTNSQVGAAEVYAWAAQFGFNEGRQSLTADIFANAPIQTPTDDGAAQAANGGNSPAAAAPGGAVPGGGGPLPFSYTDMAIADIFAAQNTDWKFTPDEGWMRLESGVFVPNQTIEYPVGQLCSAIGDPLRAQGATQAQLDVMLKGSRKHGSVVRVLRSHPAMCAKQEDFDVDPWIINTPDWVFDLRTGKAMTHEDALKQGLMFRHQTAVSPDFQAYGNYETACPRFLETLHNMTEDAQDIALLGRHGAAGLVGTDLTQVLLFIYGQGGTGKSAFSDILLRIQGSYGSAGSTSLFMKQNDKRPFELGDIATARALFVPETLKGMTWDDALICAMLGGTPIRVERKRRDSKNVRVFMTITITGNHLPNFITSSQPNKSGIDRRLLLLQVDKLLPGKPDDHFTRKLVAQEGPAILMWFVQHAMEGYQQLQADGSFYGSSIDKARKAAEAYKARTSPHRGWMEDDDIVVEPGSRMNAHQAWKSYKEWVHDDNPLHRETKQEFRDNLRDATNGAVTYGRFGAERVFLRDEADERSDRRERCTLPPR